ncbi:MAG: hypothetical protein IPL86_15990 [Flavobacteriales bacterium]|nr:hypothetical protein [Flavobacteriales bacterium]
MGLELHQLCTVFPEITGNEFLDFVESIQDEGVHHPIVLFEGKILDGRNRWRACVELGIDPPTVEFTGTYEDALAFVKRENLDRRHLTAGQRAAIIAGLANLESTRPVQGPRRQGEQTQKDRAAEAGVGVSTMRKVEAVIRTAPEVAAQVGRGEITLLEAEKIIKKAEPTKPKTESRNANVGVSAGDEPEAESEAESRNANVGVSAGDEPEIVELDEMGRLKDAYAELLSENDQLRAENESLNKVFEADDKLATALAEAARWRSVAQAVESRNVGLMSEKNFAIKAAQMWQRKFEKLERQIAKSAGGGSPPTGGS